MVSLVIIAVVWFSFVSVEVSVLELTTVRKSFMAIRNKFDFTFWRRSNLGSANKNNGLLSHFYDLTVLNDDRFKITYSKVLPASTLTSIVIKKSKIFDKRMIFIITKRQQPWILGYSKFISVPIQMEYLCTNV